MRSLYLLIAVVLVASVLAANVAPAQEDAPQYRPPAPQRHFGLDPIGQKLANDKQYTLWLESRVWDLERKVAQLERIIFRDQRIVAPAYPRPVVTPQPVPDPFPNGFPFGEAGPIGDAGPIGASQAVD
jgi:hypothetical protein